MGKVSLEEMSLRGAERRGNPLLRIKGEAHSSWLIARKREEGLREKLITPVIPAEAGIQSSWKKMSLRGAQRRGNLINFSLKIATLLSVARNDNKKMLEKSK